VNIKRLLALNALVLLGLHAAYHLEEWLWWPPDVLGSLYGPSDVGRALHAVTEAIVVLALVACVVERPLNNRTARSAEPSEKTT
jgi:hypothetical protein